MFQNIDNSMIVNLRQGRYIEIYKNDFIGCKDIKIII
jgi:hypothetical protein